MFTLVKVKDVSRQSFQPLNSLIISHNIIGLYYLWDNFGGAPRDIYFEGCMDLPLITLGPSYVLSLASRTRFRPLWYDVCTNNDQYLVQYHSGSRRVALWADRAHLFIPIYLSTNSDTHIAIPLTACFVLGEHP